MGISNEDSETQVESEAKDAEKMFDDIGNPGNQIRVVAFMCTTFGTSFTFIKKCCTADCSAVLPMIGCHSK